MFNVTTTPGGDNNNSDILLLRLPAGVGRLTVQTVGPSASDSINVVVAVPEPATVGLAAAALIIGRVRLFSRRYLMPWWATVPHSRDKSTQ